MAKDRNQDQGSHSNPGNFKNAREKASRAGRAGGLKSRSGGRRAQ